MEIGISSNQLLDIGLNLVGFLAAGMLLLLIRSALVGQAQQPFSQTSSRVKTEQEDNLSSRKGSYKDSEPGLEYMNLRAMGNEVREERESSESEDSFKAKNRREIIRMAQEMLASRGKAQLNGPPLRAGGEISPFQHNINLQGAGRSR